MSLISEHLTPWMPEVVAREPTESDCVGASKHLIYSIQAKIVVNLLGLGASGCLGTKIGKPILVVVGFCPFIVHRISCERPNGSHIPHRLRQVWNPVWS